MAPNENVPRTAKDRRDRVTEKELTQLGRKLGEPLTILHKEVDAFVEAAATFTCPRHERKAIARRCCRGWITT